MQNTAMKILLTAFLTTGAVLIALSIPLILQRIPPNQWYGFRVPATLDDPEIWYLVNVYAAWRTLLLGVLQIIVSIALYVASGIAVSVYGFIVVAFVAFGLIIILVQSFSYIGRLTLEKTDVEKNNISEAA